MATTEELLNKAIEAAQEWEPERAPYTLELYLFELNEADQNENVELWQELRSALASNTSLNNKAPSEFFDRPSLAKKGYWWWNPEAWKVPADVRRET